MMTPKEIKKTTVAHIFHDAMGFSYGSYFASGESYNVPAMSGVTVLDMRRDRERCFVHCRHDGKELYAWVNTDYLTAS